MVPASLGGRIMSAVWELKLALSVALGVALPAATDATVPADARVAEPRRPAGHLLERKLSWLGTLHPARRGGGGEIYACLPSASTIFSIAHQRGRIRRRPRSPRGRPLVTSLPRRGSDHHDHRRRRHRRRDPICVTTLVGQNRRRSPEVRQRRHRGGSGEDAFLVSLLALAAPLSHAARRLFLYL